MAKRTDQYGDQLYVILEMMTEEPENERVIQWLLQKAADALFSDRLKSVNRVMEWYASIVQCMTITTLSVDIRQPTQTVTSLISVVSPGGGLTASIRCYPSQQWYTRVRMLSASASLHARIEMATLLLFGLYYGDDCVRGPAIKDGIVTILTVHGAPELRYCLHVQNPHVPIGHDALALMDAEIQCRMQQRQQLRRESLSILPLPHPLLHLVLFFLVDYL
jgi:hypothetical protein